jgi:restriction system protein
VLSDNINRIDIKYLEQFPKFLEFKNPSDDDRDDNEGVGDTEPSSKKTPEEILEENYHTIRDNLALDLITKVKSCSPSFFEDLVIDLLLKMGYGGSRKDAGQAIGKSGDGGIDGIIKEDRLGLDTIYIQAKRWEGSVGSPEIQKFVGALHGQSARKGIFITTSNFTTSAIEYVEKIGSKIALIDGSTFWAAVNWHSS